jgi:hypothetical protein
MLLNCRGLPGLVNRRAVHLEPMAARHRGEVHLIHALSPKFKDICAMRGLQTQHNALHREIGGMRHQLRIPNWRATVDENGRYAFAIAL